MLLILEIDKICYFIEIEKDRWLQYFFPIFPYIGFTRENAHIIFVLTALSPDLTPQNYFLFSQYYEMSYGLNVEMHKQVSVQNKWRVIYGLG